MSNNVFERREKKYLVTPEQRAVVEQAALSHLEPDAFGTTLITSVYLDTPERSLIARSLEKPLYKEKLRLRAYGDRAGEALIMLCRDGLQAVQAAYGDELLALPAFFELKKKFKGIVYKRRVRMSLPAAWAFAQGASYEAACATYPLNEEATDDATGEPISCCASEADAYRDQQIARELEAALARYENLQPSCAIFCHRTAWAPREGEENAPRITFDDGLSFLDLFDSEATVQPIIPASTTVMEVKASAAMPSWIIVTLSGSNIYPRSFSKYGEAAKLMNEDRNSVRAGAEGRGASGFPRSRVDSHGSLRRRSARSAPKHPFPELRPTTFTLFKKEDLEYNGLFDSVLDRYTAEHELLSVQTTNMGSLFQLEYQLRMKAQNMEKAFIDELRCLNGNLKISLGYAPKTREVL